MNLNQYLSEEFKGYAKSDVVREPVAYYVNPTPSEMLEVSREDHEVSSISSTMRVRRKNNIRFILDLNKRKLIIFSAMCLHYEVGVEMGYPSEYFKRDTDVNNIFNGEATYNEIERKLDFLYSDTLYNKSADFVKNMSKFDWSFGDKYFTKPVKKILASIKPNGKIYKLDKKTVA